MKKNLYYRHVFRRRNAIKEFFLKLILAISSGPRLLLEVFIRRNFGERYFSFSSAIILAIVMAALPLGIIWVYRFFNPLPSDVNGMTNLHHYFYPSYPQTLYWFYKHWYAFIVVFLIVCLMRREEVKRLPSVFDFARFSLSTGEIHPLFIKLIESPRSGITVRLVETVLEPALFFFIGLVLVWLNMDLGYLLILCSIIYSLSYVAAYHIGDNFVMDRIDEMICNQELSNAFVDGLAPSKTRGVNYYGRRPKDTDVRRLVAESFVEDEDEAEAR